MNGISPSDRLLSLFRPRKEAARKLPDLVKANAVVAEEDGSPVAHRLRELLESSQRDGVVFQSVLVACLKTIERVRSSEEHVSKASISLAQQEKLDHLLAEIVIIDQALREALTTQGQRMLDMSEPSAHDGAESRWWYALAEAIEELEKGTERMASLVGNQPRGTEVRRVAGTIVRLLHKHHAQLVMEAEEWMS